MSLAGRWMSVACRDHSPDVSATLTTTAFDRSSSRWLGSSDLIAETRRALLHLSYSCAQPFGPAMLVTHDPKRKWSKSSLDHLVGAREQHRRRSRPSALAVLRLITKSYLVGACTGRSAGFSPL